MTRGMFTLKFVTVLVCLVVLTGCENKKEGKSSREAIDAETLSKFREDLSRVKRDMASFDKELRAVKSAQEEFEHFTARLDAQQESLEKLENEIKELNVFIGKQQIAIDRQLAALAELVNLIKMQALPEEQQENIEQQEELQEEPQADIY